MLGYAQKADSTGFFIMPGVTFTPLTFGKGYSTSTYYSIQCGTHKFPVKGVVRFGFPNYAVELSSRGQVDYTIKGGYVEPGAIMYFGDINKHDVVFLLGLLGYFGKYHHQLEMEITDANWGTSQEYTFTEETSVSGFVFEVGMMFTFYEKIKGTLSINTGKIRIPENPIQQVRNFRNQSTLVPGAGYGPDLLFGINFGLHYIID